MTHLFYETIRLEQQSDYARVIAATPQVPSDYSFTNLWGWAEEYGLQWAWSDGLVWIRQERPRLTHWAPMGDWNLVDWQSTLEAWDVGSRFIRVPQTLHEIWSNRLSNGVTVKETRGQWDYLYSAADLIQLSGNRYHRKKNLVNQFKRKYPYTYLPMNEEMVAKALEMQSDWCVWRDCEAHESLAAENRVIERILKQWEALRGLTGGAVVVEGQLACYTIAERIASDHLIIHFEKGDPDFKGSYQAINQLFLAHQAEPDTHVNREQDLENPGLRKAKLSYHPIDYIRKNEVILD
ncbi:MAG: phosphatidylglycerol lysyltransferase domain-containing protein [Desulfosarcinaceae bacterium]|nr:phosphatidylglycerol lysyltransferase domain-containing protein [Desulfosarcinaceae bacterium]